MVPSEAHANLFSTSQASQENLVTCNKADVNARRTRTILAMSSWLWFSVAGACFYGWASAHCISALKPVHQEDRLFWPFRISTMCLSTPLRAVKSKSAFLLPATSSKDSLQVAPRNDTLPSRDEAIQMILSSRWWDPSMGASLPFASLLSHNSIQDAGWLKGLLFPAAGTSNISGCFDEKLTLSYLLIIAEAEGLAHKLAEAWGETEESAKAITKSTVAKFAYHPILENFPHEYHVSTEPLTFLFSLFPSGCLGCLDKDAGKLAVVFLDAALFRRGRCHSNNVKRLFINCDGSTIGTIRNQVVGDLFRRFADFESLYAPSKSLTPPKYTAIKESHQAIIGRNPLAAVNKPPIQARAVKKDQRLKRQHSMTLHSHQQNKKKTKLEKEN